MQNWVRKIQQVHRSTYIVAIDFHMLQLCQHHFHRHHHYYTLIICKTEILMRLRNNNWHSMAFLFEFNFDDVSIKWNKKLMKINSTNKTKGTHDYNVISSIRTTTVRWMMHQNVRFCYAVLTVQRYTYIYFQLLNAD